MKRFVLAAVMSTGFTAFAGEGCFSADGSRVWLICPGAETARIEEIGLDDDRHRFHDLQQHQGMGVIEQIECLADDSLLLMCKDGIWKCPSGFKQAQMMHRCPDEAAFTRIALSHPGQRLAVWCRFEKSDESGHRGALMIANGGDLQKVRMRRVSDIDSLCFYGKDRLMFGTEGDLWDGLIDENDRGRPVLTAQRFAPLADRETYDGTPMQTGVSRVAASARKVYVHQCRMGGSGWGSVIRLSTPEKCQPAPASQEACDHLQIYCNALKSVEFLEDNGSLSFLCASHDGRRVFFTSGAGSGRSCYLVENDGAPQPVKIHPATP